MAFLRFVAAAVIFIHIAFAQYVEYEDGYNENTIPDKAKDRPLPQEINIDMYIDDIFSISREGVLETRVRVVERWVDLRLKAKEVDPGQRIELKDTEVWLP